MKKLLVITLMASFSAMVLAQGSPIAVTGFTQDVIANGTNVGSYNYNYAYNSTTTTLDSYYVLYNQSYFGDGSGLPDNGTITSAYDGTKFQLADYSSNNVLLLFENGESDPVTGDAQYAGTLSFATPGKFSSLSFLLAGYNAGNTPIPGEYFLNFTNGTSTSGTFGAPDNFDSTANIAFSALGRVTRNGDAEQYVGNAPYLDQLNVTLTGADLGLTLDSVTFVNTGTGGGGYNTIGVFGISGTPEAVPTPAMLLPMGIGALVLLNRKRRV